MAQRIVVVGGNSYNNNAALVSAMNTIHNANPAAIIIDHFGSQAAVFARNWAQSKGVPWYSYDSQLTGEGHEPIERNLRLLRLARADLVVTFGSDPIVQNLLSVANALKIATSVN